MFEVNWHAAGLRRLGRRRAGPRLHGGLFVETQDPLVGLQGAGVEVHDRQRLLRKGLVARRPAAEPVVHAPGLELLRLEDPLHRLGRDARHNPVALEGPRQLGAGPQRQRTVRLIRQLAGQLDQVGCYLGGKSGAVARSVVRPGGRRGVF